MAPLASCEALRLVRPLPLPLMAPAMKEIGSLVQDRQSSIMADTNLRSPTIPIDITIGATAGAHKDGGAFHVTETPAAAPA